MFLFNNSDGRPIQINNEKTGKDIRNMKFKNNILGTIPVSIPDEHENVKVPLD